MPIVQVFVYQHSPSALVVSNHGGPVHTYRYDGIYGWTSSATFSLQGYFRAPH